MNNCKGHLVLVVGPSGAGKDSVLQGAKEKLAGNRRFVFPRRFVTRDADRNAEDHFSMTDMEFAISLSRDAFSLSWNAHGNSYGIGKSIETDLQAGCVVAVNCSRAVLSKAAEQFPNLTVIEINASQHVLVSRIVARGRETEEQALTRVARKVPDFPADIRIVHIINDGPLIDAIDRFCSVLRSLQDAVANPCGRTLDGEDQKEDCDDDGRGLIVVEKFQRNL